jgi:hypothetical protein
MHTLILDNTSLRSRLVQLHLRFAVGLFFFLIEDKGEIDGPKEEDAIQI